MQTEVTRKLFTVDEFYQMGNAGIFAPDARLELPEVWIEDLKKEEILIYRNPTSNGYGTCLPLKHGNSVSPLAFPDLVIPIAELLG